MESHRTKKHISHSPSVLDGAIKLLKVCAPIFAFVMLFASGKSVLAYGSDNFVTNEVGEHARILVVKKSVNPQNLMAVYTKVASDCSFLPDPAQSGHVLFDFYWLMDGSRYKPVNSLIKREIRNRLDAKATRDPFSFTVMVNDLRQVKTDIPEQNFKLDVVSTKTPKGCAVKGLMTLGPSAGNARIVLKELYTNASVNIFTRSVKVRQIVLTGTDAKTGAPVRQTFAGR